MNVTELFAEFVSLAFATPAPNAMVVAPEAKPLFSGMVSVMFGKAVVGARLSLLVQVNAWPAVGVPHVHPAALETDGPE